MSPVDGKHYSSANKLKSSLRWPALVVAVTVFGTSISAANAAGCQYYGTEECPYPPFGNSSDSAERPPAGPTADSIMENQKHKKRKGPPTDSSGALIPEQSKGPSPFGNGPLAGGGVIKRPSRDLKSNILNKQPEPCGPGMYRGANTECYPSVR